jgi:hypothetical protein
MSRGVALSVLRALLRAELKESSEANTARDTELNYALANGQKTLASKFDWTFLKDRWDKSVTAGSRYVTLPTSNIRGIASTINFERTCVVERKWSNIWQEVDYGIDSVQYNYVDSDLLRSQDPIQRWQLDTNTGDASNPNEFEVWPIPATATTLRFSGQRAVRALASDSDLADLDDLLLVYFAAMEYLTLRKLASAPLAIKKYSDHFTMIRSGYPAIQQPPIHLGRRPFERQNVKLIAVR